jgi:hypothetical protein
MITLGIEVGVKTEVRIAQKNRAGALRWGAKEPRLILPASAVREQETCYRRKLSSLDSQRQKDEHLLAEFPLRRRKIAQWCRRSPGKKLSHQPLQLGAFFFTAQKFVALNCSHYAYGAFFARFGALHASETAHTHWTCQSNFIRKSQEYFNSRTFFYVFLKEKIHSAGADIAGFCTCFTNGRTCSPTNGERKAHGKALGSAAFWAGQSGTSWSNAV